MSQDKPNLKKILMELGNKLVLEYRYEPYSGAEPTTQKTTRPITLLTEWINRYPEAQQALEDIGVEWPM